MKIPQIIERRREEINRINAGMSIVSDDPFIGHPLSPTERRFRVLSTESPWDAFKFFAETYLPEYFTSPFGTFHNDLVMFASGRAKEFHVVAAPPEHGKSILFIAWKLFCGITGYRNKYAQISETAEIAAINLDLVRLEFRYNTRIVADFGGNLIDPEHDRSGDFVVNNYGKSTKTNFKAFGRKSSLKGWLFYQYRIDAVEFDDFEPAEAANNQRLVQARLRWLFSEVWGRVSRTGALVWIHNNARAESAADKIHTGKENRKNLYSHRYRAIENGVPLWERYTLSDLDDIRLSVGNTTWRGDWMQEPIVEGLLFRAEWIRSYKELPNDLRIVGRIDPSLSDVGDTKSIILLGYSATTRLYYIVDAFVRRASIAAMIDAMYIMYEKWRNLGLLNMKVEESFRQDLIYAPHYDLAEQRNGYRLPVSGFSSRVAKKDRIATLESPIELGLILFPCGWEQNEDMKELVDQLLGFPEHKNDDGPDALAQCYTDLAPQRRIRAGEKLWNKMQRIKSALTDP